MKTKIILSLIIFFTLLGCDSGEKEIIVIPDNYKGYILIIFNQENGTSIKYKNKKRIYRIPQNGVLKTQFSGNYGSVGFTEFYYEEIKPENKLPSFARITQIPENTVVGLRGATGTVKKNAESEERIEFVEFYVGTKEQIEQAKENIKKLDIVKLAE